MVQFHRARLWGSLLLLLFCYPLTRPVSLPTSSFLSLPSTLLSDRRYTNKSNGKNCHCHIYFRSGFQQSGHFRPFSATISPGLFEMAAMPFPCNGPLLCCVNICHCLHQSDHYPLIFTIVIVIWGYGLSLLVLSEVQVTVLFNFLTLNKTLLSATILSLVGVKTSDRSSLSKTPTEDRTRHAGSCPVMN